MVLNELFSSLMSKTLLILAIALLISYGGALTLKPLMTRLMTRRKYLDMKPDEAEAMIFFKLLFGAIAVGLVSFSGMFLTKPHLLVSLGLMALYAFVTGMVLSMCLWYVDSRLASKVVGLTALLTLAAALVATQTDLDFSFLRIFLLVGVTGSISMNFYLLVTKVSGVKRKLFALFGIMIFLAFLLYDFNRLKKMNSLGRYNTWLAAQESAVDIYTDIVNLFIYILDLLTDDDSSSH